LRQSTYTLFGKPDVSWLALLKTGGGLLLYISTGSRDAKAQHRAFVSIEALRASRANLIGAGQSAVARFSVR
jgi:hypothetical protein